MRSNHITVAGKGTHVSALELILMETLAMNSMRATSWLGQWLSALGKMVDRETHLELMEMLLSGGKSLRYVCQQETALWVEILLKRRDAALQSHLTDRGREDQAKELSSHLYRFPLLSRLSH